MRQFLTKTAASVVVAMGTAGAALALTGAPAQADWPHPQVAQAVLSEVSAYDLEISIEDYGAYDIEIEIDSYGDPIIYATWEGINFSVLFYACDGDYCSQFQYRAVFEASRREMRDAIEARNAEFVLGKGYVSDGEAYLEHAINVRGGVTESFLDNQAGEWFDMLAEFAGRLGYY